MSGLGGVQPWYNTRGGGGGAGGIGFGAGGMYGFGTFDVQMRRLQYGAALVAHLYTRNPSHCMEVTAVLQRHVFPPQWKQIMADAVPYSDTGYAPLYQPGDDVPQL